jgi:YesN/AraC family two-component response regulator
MRVELAKQKLEITNLSFDEISYQVGYINPGSFSKIFVKWVGVLPSVCWQKFRDHRQRKVY